jgi:hypothetical protein
MYIIEDSRTGSVLAQVNGSFSQANKKANKFGIYARVKYANNMASRFMKAVEAEVNAYEDMNESL